MRTVRVIAAAVLLLVAGSAAVAAAASGFGEPVRLQVPVSLPATIAPGSYWFQFSLYRRTDLDHPEALAWRETMSLDGPRKALKAGTIAHLLGSLDPAGHPLEAWIFDEQLWVRAEYRKAGQWLPGSKLVRLTVAPYAIWSAATAQGFCVPGDWVSCYGGPAGTLGRGPCKAGTRTSSAAGTFAGAGCMGQVVPQEELCNGVDDDCDVGVDEDAIDCGPGEVCIEASCQQVETVCDDGIDNDQDGTTDCDDTDCAGGPDCLP